MGRFMQTDPLIQDGMDSEVTNPYAYVAWNPMSYTDPTGMYMEGIECDFGCPMQPEHPGYEEFMDDHRDDSPRPEPNATPVPGCCDSGDGSLVGDIARDAVAGFMAANDAYDEYVLNYVPQTLGQKGDAFNAWWDENVLGSIPDPPDEVEYLLTCFTLPIVSGLEDMSMYLLQTGAASRGIYVPSEFYMAYSVSSNASDGYQYSEMCVNY